MFLQVSIPNTFPPLDTMLSATPPSSSLFSPPQVSSKTRSTLKQQIEGDSYSIGLSQDMCPLDLRARLTFHSVTAVHDIPEKVAA